MMKYIKLFENFYDDTSWTKEIDGKEETITIHDIQEYLKNDDVVNIKVDDIKHMCIHKNKKDKKTIERSQKADLNYPIIISKGTDGKFKMILDGHHRLKKAIDDSVEFIKAKIIDLRNTPDIYKNMFE